MNFLYSKYLKNLLFGSKVLSISISATVFSALIPQIAQAAQITFSFAPDTDEAYPAGAINDWGHSNPSNYGWRTVGGVGTEYTGTAIDSVTGVEVTFTGAIADSNSASDPNHLFGSAESKAGNLKFDSDHPTTRGLGVFNTNDSDDGNGITVSSNRILSGGTLENYQLLTFQFSKPIIIDSDTRFFIDDIDDDTKSGANDIYIDAVAVEGFVTETIGDPGTGIDPNFSFNSTTDLSTSTIDIGTGSESITYAYDSIDSGSNPNRATQSRAYYDFGSSQPIQSIALRYFNGSDNIDGVNGHGVVFGGSFTVEEVPFEFSPSLGLLLSGVSLFGANYFRKKRVLSQ